MPTSPGGMAQFGLPCASGASRMRPFLSSKEFDRDSGTDVLCLPSRAVGRHLNTGPAFGRHLRALPAAADHGSDGPLEGHETAVGLLLVP